METLVEGREANMIALSSSRQPMKRKGFFLKPTSALNHDSLPPQHNAISGDIREVPKNQAMFRWWANPQSQWEIWVEKLKPIYGDLWKKVGIYDAIMVYSYKFMRDPSILWGVVRFWCQETNTFVFPWAEATITLEDVMVLGGFSVLGEPVRVSGPLQGELGDLESEIKRELKSVKVRSQRGAVDHCAWIRHCIEGGKGDELEHVAFLVLWLSRYVLAQTISYIRTGAVLQIACRLARGVRIALAPAVLASIYRDLRLMKDQLSDPPASPIAVHAPLNILQLWVWERFFQRVNLGRVLSSDEPRAAMWCDMKTKMDFSSVISALASPEQQFQWKPYSAYRSSVYKDIGRWYFQSNRAKDEELQSHARCLRPCELVGLDCIEQYLPHRVAMQFGLDQDIPKVVPRANSSWTGAWETYDVREKIVEFYVPSRLSESGVTEQYSVWWKNAQSKETTIGTKRHIEMPLPRRNKKRVDHYGVADPAPGYNDNSSTDTRSEMQEEHDCVMDAMQTSTNPPLNQHLDVTRAVKETKSQLVHEIADDLKGIEKTEENRDLKEMEVNRMVKMKELVEAKWRAEVLRERAAVRLGGLKDDADIGKLQEEMAVYHGIAKDLEYLAEMYSRELVSSIS